MKSIQSITERMIYQAKHTRRQTLIHELNAHGIKYHTESCGDACENVVVSLTDQSRYTLFVAHYDVYGTSLGINDNTVAIATLISSIKEMMSKKYHLPVKVLFADKEESGMIGSQYFAHQYQHDLQAVIVLDIVGFGDRLIHGSKQPQDFHMLDILGIQNIKTVMPSDNLSFIRHNIKTTLITACFNEELKEENGMIDVSYPWYFSTSFHNGINDNDMNKINFELAEKLKEILLTLLLRKEVSYDTTIESRSI
jgi:hypothetical protein